MTDKPRTIRVEALTRVEGEGGLFVRMRGGRVDELRLEIYEPPRLFEALLRGRHFNEVADITARICGICPIAYQMSAVHALEAALACHPPAQVRQLRRLLYCGEWIESHALHMHLLHAPDFLGFKSGLAMAADYPEEVKRGLALKKHANQLLALFGGRAIHPINVAVGGFYRLPDPSAVARLIPDFEWGLAAAIDVTRWIGSFEFPEFDADYEMVALVHPDEYPMNEGRIASNRGLSIAAADFDAYFAESQVPHSTAMHCLKRDTQSTYLVGPLARVNLNFDRLAEPARRLADELPIEWPCANPYRSILARGLEVVHAYAEALEILRNVRAAACAARDARRGPVGGRGCHRGTARLVVPPLRNRRGRVDPPGNDHPAHVSEPGPDRGRPAATRQPYFRR